MNILIGNDTNKINVVSDPSLLANYEFKSSYIQHNDLRVFCLHMYIKSIKVANIACYKIYKSGSTYYVQTLHQKWKKGYICVPCFNRIFLNNDAMEDYKVALKKVKEKVDAAIKLGKSRGAIVNTHDYCD